MESYNTVILRKEVIIEVKKSKFIGIIVSCNDINEFELQLQVIKALYPKASHYCYGYRIKETMLLEKYQDDKEPSGTAGVPILEILKGKDLMQCAIVVVRYFGGTKLGTGGLSRAYSDAAREVLSMSEVVVKEEACYMDVQVDYHYSGKMDHYISTNSIPLLDTLYSSSVIYKLAIRSNLVHQMNEEIMELTNGKAIVKNEDRVMGFFGEGTFSLS